MSEFEDYFPYPSYRTSQETMLQRVYDAANAGKVLMVSAPTGTGKSSVIVPLCALAKKTGKKVIVGVRTISQLKIFSQELERIRATKQPNLKFTSFVGKSTICPKLVPGNDPYVFCNIMKQMAMRAMMDAFVVTDYCEYYYNSYSYSEGQLYPTQYLTDCARNCCTHMVTDSETIQASASVGGVNVCPYEMLCQSARDSDVIIVNYNHLLDEGIRKSFFYNLGIEPEMCYILLDEAHNISDAVQSIQSVSITARQLKDAESEIGYFAGNTNKNTSAISAIVRYLQQIVSQYENAKDMEGVIDGEKFMSGMLTFDTALDDLEKLVEYLRKNPVSNFEYKECGCEKIYKFLVGARRASHDNDYLIVYNKGQYGVSLESKNIDPSNTLVSFVSLFASVCMISGTLSPVKMYAKYYFADKIEVEQFELANIFPKKNRKIYICGDITTLYNKRDDVGNIRAIVEYLTKFVNDTHGSVAVYFPSYAIMNQYVDKLKPQFKRGKIGGKRVFIEPKRSGEASDLLQQFFDLPETGECGAMFAVSGGKWSEGLDFSGDILSGAMVIGLPLAQFTPVRRVINEHFKNKFGDEGEYIAYTLPAINRACQALGRVIRTETDKGVLVLGDFRYANSRVNIGLPQWIKEEAVKTKSKDIVFTF